jgi:DNA-binding CsgD family transcriptional regulator
MTSPASIDEVLGWGGVAAGAEMSLDESDRLLDLIYEAAAIPEMWPAVLDALAGMVRGVGTFLITANTSSFRWTHSESVRQLGQDFLEGRWHERNPRMERLLSHRHSGFIREVDMFTAEEMDRDPTFQELLRPRGFGWAVGTVVQVPSDDMLAFSIERRFADGPVEDHHLPRLNALRPHLARAAMMSARLRFEHAQGMADSLTAMGLPSAVLLGNGKVISTNASFDQVGPQIVSTAFGGIALANTEANALLKKAIEELNAVAFQHGAKSIAVPAEESGTALIVHLIPVRRSAHDIFGPAMGVLVVTPLGSSQTLSDDLLNGLFDLSPAEIRAAQGLLAGKSIDDLATDLGLSRETIRSQVKAVLAKTGTSRQADLMALLSNVKTPAWYAKT